ncbi:hypothetical protein YC2023_029236 [Brassica napus]
MKIQFRHLVTPLAQLAGSWLRLFASYLGGTSASPMTDGFDSDDLPSSPVESLAYLRNFPEFCSRLLAFAGGSSIGFLLSSFLCCLEVRC